MAAIAGQAPPIDRRLRLSASAPPDGPEDGFLQAWIGKPGGTMELPEFQEAFVSTKAKIQQRITGMWRT